MARMIMGSRSSEPQGTAIYERDAEGWVARIVGRPEIEARGGSLALTRKRLRELLAKDHDGSGEDAGQDGSQAEPPEEIRLPQASREVLARLARALVAVDEAEKAAVVTLVRRLGLTVRDASDVLGVPMRRVVHHAGEAADIEAQRKQLRRAIHRTAARATR